MSGKERTNNWRATTIRGQLRKGVKAEGAVGYTSAFWGKEQEHDRKSAIVTVLLEVNPRFGEPGFHVDPNVRRESAKRARSWRMKCSYRDILVLISNATHRHKLSAVRSFSPKDIPCRFPNSTAQDRRRSLAMVIDGRDPSSLTIRLLE